MSQKAIFLTCAKSKYDTQVIIIFLIVEYSYHVAIEHFEDHIYQCNYTTLAIVAMGDQKGYLVFLTNLHNRAGTSAS